MAFRTLAILCLLSIRLIAQSVQPVISEYKIKGEGKFEVTNNTLTPMVVLLEPRSFSITSQGKGIFRALDPGIHVDLSTTSLKLAPRQTAYVFYKAEADQLPAWFTVYATFSAPIHSGTVDMRIMLPHTVYLYQEHPLAADDVHIGEVTYHTATNKLSVELVNQGISLGRVQEIHSIGGHGAADAPGFPLLPHGQRTVEIAWTGKEPPSELSFRFDHFTVRRPVSRQ